eukprot:scaffold141915_cov26-Prasinocladus_malaysianus.AAC.1
MRAILERAQEFLRGHEASHNGLLSAQQDSRGAPSGSQRGSKFVCVACPGLIVSRAPTHNRRPSNLLAKGLFASVSGSTSPEGAPYVALT